MAKRRLEVVISGDASSLNRTLGQASQGTKRFGDSIGGMVKRAAGFALAGAGVAGLGAAIGGMVAEAREAERVGRLTDAVLKSTGATSWISAGQVGAYAEKLGQLIGVDDDLIQQNANVLLTFTRVRNEAGKGNDVFNRTVGLAHDMAAALGTDAKGAVLQLGKALNDPIKGVTKLTRAGVTFTEQQKAQIKALAESGDILGAQKIILAEVSKEFGGAAAASADPMQRLRVTIDNLKERVGLALLPILNKAATWLGKNLPKALETAQKWFKRIVPVVKTVAQWISRNRDVILPFVAALLAAFAAFKVFMFIKTVTTAVMAFNAALVANPIGLVVVAIAALVAGIIVAYQRFEAFRNIVNTVGEAIKVAAEFIWKVVKTYLTFVINFWRYVWNTARTIVRVVWDAIGSKVKTVAKFVYDVVVKYLQMVFAYWSFVWKLAKTLVTGVWDGIKTAVDLGMRAIDFGVRNVLNPLITAWSFAWNGMKAIAESVWGGIKAVINGVLSGIETAYNAFRSFWNAVEVKVPGFNPPGPGPSFGGFTFGLPDLPSIDVPRLHTGGVFQAPNGESEGLAMLETGERVIPRGDAGTNITLDMRGALIVGTKEALGRIVEEALVARGRVNGPIRIKVA